MAVNTITLSTQPRDGDSFPELTAVASQLDELRLVAYPPIMLPDAVIQIVSTVDLNWHGIDSTGTNDFPIAAGVPFDLRPQLRGGDTRSFYYTPAANGLVRIAIAAVNARLMLS